MHIFFCSDPLERRRADAVYASEFAAARDVVDACHLIDFEGLEMSGKPFAEVTPPQRQEPAVEAVYRGWMLSPAQYRRLYGALEARGYMLVNSPEQYRHCHYLPESYGVLEGVTPQTVWLEGAEHSDADICDAASAFGDAAIIVKDYVKSQKHYWDEACFVPSASDTERLLQVVRRFIELQGGELEGGLVLRRYVEFETLPTVDEGDAPSVLEYRLFFFDGRLVSLAPYWDESDYPSALEVPVDRFGEVADRIDSRFFSMDVARTVDGEWLVVEVGDGQVSGLPERVDEDEFFAELGQEGT
ncbi:hypothetical protein FIV42_02005 [Persicimonas caeni]|uniref:ATP-grasp domain-containing protein n=1 Tax=Persicimonas caeni TaxID=2292766 RepID=A0A4Y6PMX0_PERCE|nr:ATP-grasp domain-containing protein [Persicimonas caeni]QDG49553.1 hypothetical protein FIV42_02005 [Persicimonas caeni]QED30774.1 hypothetical protein FRD00_02000 [Persicimonas caeni]